jgi:hypothetical protein
MGKAKDVTHVLIHLAAIVLAFVCILRAHKPKDVTFLPRTPAHHIGCRYTTCSVFECWCVLVTELVSVHSQPDLDLDASFLMYTPAGAAMRPLVPLVSCSTSFVASTSYAPRLSTVQKTLLGVCLVYFRRQVLTKRTIAGSRSCARRWAAAKSDPPGSVLVDDLPSSITAASFGKPHPRGHDGGNSALSKNRESIARLGPAVRGGTAKYSKFGLSAEKTLETWGSLKSKLNPAIIRVVALDHIRWSHMTPVQSQVLELLPGLANPHTPGVPNEGRKDILIRSSPGTGKTAAFLIPAIEARQRAIRSAATKAVAKAGLISSKEQENSSMRVYSRTHVGALILCPTREAATQVANDAIRLSHFYRGFEVRLLVGGMSKKQQMRDWMLGRRDIVVSTPGRLRDLLYSEPDIVEGLRTVQNVRAFFG